jgi:hypothetical protein
MYLFSGLNLGYPIMEFFLNKTGRPILYSCSWPAYFTLNAGGSKIVSICFIDLLNERIG